MLVVTKSCYSAIFITSTIKAPDNDKSKRKLPNR